MGKRGHGKSLILTEQLQEKYLAILGDGTPPFLMVAADRAGIPRGRLNEWLYGDSDNPILEDFRVECYKVRGEWIAAAVKRLETATKDNAEGMRQLQWVITCLDQELFNLKRGEPKAPAVDKRPTPAPAADAPSVQAASTDLEEPEPFTRPTH